VRVDVAPELDQVVLRHDTRELLLRGAVLLIAGTAVPAWVEATVPALIIPALLVTLAAAFWAVQSMTAVLVLDDIGVTITAARRGRGRIPWSQVAALELEAFRVVVRTVTGARVAGPPADIDVLQRTMTAAGSLGILPTHLDN
jgi:hypothetical protein